MQGVDLALKTARTLVSFDWAMKCVLRNKASFDVLEGFLTTLLNQAIDESHSKNIQQAREKLNVLKMSEEERRVYEAFLVACAAQDDALQTARTEGKAAGKAEGERDKTHQIACSMMQEGLTRR